MATEPDIEIEEDNPIEIDLGVDDDALAKATELEAEKPELDAGTKALTEQLEAAKQALALETAGRQEAEQRAAEALAFAQQRDREAWESSRRETQSYADMAQTGLAGAQAELTAATQAHKVAFEAGDADGISAAVARIGRAGAEIKGWEQSAAEATQREAYTRQQAQQPRQPQQPQQFTAEQLLMRNEQNPNILPSEKAYLRQHHELTLDQRMQRRLQVAVEEATDKGINRGSDAFFQHLDQRMGYDGGSKQSTPARGSVVSAPVSRGSGGPAAKPEKVALKSNDMEMLNSGIEAMGRQIGLTVEQTRKLYARNKLNVPERMKELNGGMK